MTRHARRVLAACQVQHQRSVAMRRANDTWRCTADPASVTYWNLKSSSNFHNYTKINVFWNQIFNSRSLYYTLCIPWSPASPIRQNIIMSAFRKLVIGCVWNLVSTRFVVVVAVVVVAAAAADDDDDDDGGDGNVDDDDFFHDIVILCISVVYIVILYTRLKYMKGHGPVPNKPRGFRGRKAPCLLTYLWTYVFRVLCSSSVADGMFVFPEMKTWCSLCTEQVRTFRYRGHYVPAWSCGDGGELSTPVSVAMGDALDS